MEKLNIFNRPHIMVDLETLSTHQNAVIVQLGACSFTFENGIEREFIVNIDPVNAKQYGLHISKSTIDWWMEQPKEVRLSWQHDQQPLVDALTSFNEFVGDNTKQFIWAHGAALDLGALRFNFEATKIERKWKYWNEMDNRTAFNLLGIDNRKVRKDDSMHHNALADAICQTNTLINLFK